MVGQTRNVLDINLDTHTHTHTHTHTQTMPMLHVHVHIHSFLPQKLLPPEKTLIVVMISRSSKFVVIIKPHQRKLTTFIKLHVHTLLYNIVLQYIYMCVSRFIVQVRTCIYSTVPLIIHNYVWKEIM